MYRIVGEDGKEYGPVSLDEIKRWLAEGRLNADTMVMPEGGTRWQKLSEFPELSGSGGRSPQAEGMVSGPAVGLIVTAILGFVVQASSIAYRSFVPVTNPFANGNAPPGLSPEAFQFFTGPMSMVFGLIGVAVGVVILIGALKMKKLESREWAMTSSILAMIPCISPCCIVGLPIGIWALVVLSKPELKNAFR
jgi:hypothetical protein